MPEQSSEILPEIQVDTKDTYGAFIDDMRSKDLKILSKDEMRDQFNALRNSDSPDTQSEARNTIIDSSLRLIPFVLKSLPERGIADEELVGEAFETINACINNFDPDKVSPKTEETVSFSSYVIASLKRNLSSPRSVVRTGEPITIPAHVEDISNLMRRARELFMQEEEHEPTQEEWYKRTIRLAGETRSLRILELITNDTFEATNRAKLQGIAPTGRDTARGHIDSDSLSPRIGSVEETLQDKTLDVEEEAIKGVFQEDMAEVLQTLPDRDRTILELRFGIGLNEEGKPKVPLTLQQTGDIFGLSSGRILQLVESALRKMRHPQRARKIEYYLEETYPHYGKDAQDKENFDGMLKQAADSLLKKDYDREKIVEYLKELRKGSEVDGKLDAEQLAPLFNDEQIKELKSKEEKMLISSRMLSKELMDNINGGISLLPTDSLYNKRGYGTSHEMDNYYRQFKQIGYDEIITFPRPPSPKT